MRISNAQEYDINHSIFCFSFRFVFVYSNQCNSLNPQLYKRKLTAEEEEEERKNPIKIQCGC